MDFLRHIAPIGETGQTEAAVGIPKKEMAGLQDENCVLRPVGVPRRFLRSTM